MTHAALGFPIWIRATHWINVLFIGFLIRAGIQILAAYPRLYWNVHCTPGTEWLKFTKKPMPPDRLWTALDMEEKVPAWLGQPGGNNLGMGRHWHFGAALFWVLNGLVYVVLLFVTGEWRRLIPTTWGIFPAAWHTLVTYITLGKQPANVFYPFDPLQQLVYAAVIFLLAPFLIITAAAQSPSIEAQFPGYARLFGGRQGARSLHFLGLVAFIGFIIVHTALVAYTGFFPNMGNIIFGQPHRNQAWAVAIGLSAIVVILLIYGLTSWYSRVAPRRVQQTLGALIGPPMRALALRARSRQQYPSSTISPYFIVNGRPPDTSEYDQLQQDGFKDWRLEVYGLVAQPLSFSLAEVLALPKQTQITTHHCIQGWSGIAEWGGPPLDAILKRCRPLPTAHYMIFHSYQCDETGRFFYEALDIRMATHPQTLLAYEMNGAPLTVPHGAPLRLRVETLLGFKMVKWLRAIEFVADYRGIRDGQGGSREDSMYYEQSVSI
jgi:methionine sulfoxide reductase catalytic subunit